MVGTGESSGEVETGVGVDPGEELDEVELDSADVPVVVVPLELVMLPVPVPLVPVVPLLVVPLSVVPDEEPDVMPAPLPLLISTVLSVAYP